MSGVFAVRCSWSWCTDKRRRSVPTCRRIEEGAASGGITLTRPITRACWPGGGGDDGCAAGGTRGAPAAKNASTAEGVPARRSSRGGINQWTCSVPHETVFCVGWRGSGARASPRARCASCAGRWCRGERRPPRASAALTFRPRVWANCDRRVFATSRSRLAALYDSAKSLSCCKPTTGSVGCPDARTWISYGSLGSDETSTAASPLHGRARAARSGSCRPPPG